MGDCTFCGKSAGFLRSQHKECANAHDNAANAITSLCVNAALRSADLDLLPQSIRETAVTGYMDMSDGDLRQTLADGWRKAVDAAMEDHSLSTEEKRGLNRYRGRFKLHEAELDSGGHFELFRMMVLLNSMVEHGNIPRLDRRSARAQFGRLPFNLMKSEALVWVFNGIGYMEQVTHREFQGQSMGMSFRVAKGVYVRPGTFRGRAVESSSMEQTDSGMLGLTTKHIYFSGRKSFRVRLEKIVTFEPYQDGLGIMRDTARAKPEAFTMGQADAWFLINVIDALLDMEDISLPKSGSPSLDDLLEDDGPDHEGEDDAGLFGLGAGTSL